MNKYIHYTSSWFYYTRTAHGVVEGESLFFSLIPSVRKQIVVSSSEFFFLFLNGSGAAPFVSGPCWVRVGIRVWVRGWVYARTLLHSTRKCFLAGNNVQ